MKRLFTFIFLIVIIVVGCYLVKKGFENEVYDISSYETIETKSEALTKKLAAYDKKNEEEYNTAVSNLNTSTKAYKESKAKYDEIYAELADVINNNEDENEVIEEIIYSDKEKYKVDFLLVTLGDYGAEEGVDVVYQLTTSSTIDPNSSTLKYFLADLKFTVTGQYIDVANFISDLENDNKLGWEINDFAMESGSANGYTGVSAVFTIRDVPIDSESFIASEGTNNTTDGNQNQNQTSTQNQGQRTSQNSGTNTATTNTTTTPVTNTVSNTTNTASTSNTTNTVR